MRENVYEKEKIKLEKWFAILNKWKSFFKDEAFMIKQKMFLS
jgi:hypothetical protein